MKFVVNYKRNGIDCWAETTFNGEYMVGIGSSWIDARQRLIMKLRVVLENNAEHIPDPETLEL